MENSDPSALRSDSEMEPKMLRIVGMQQILDHEQGHWEIPDDHYQRVVQLQAMLTSSFSIGHALSTHGLHVSTCLAASRSVFLGETPIDAVQIIVEQDRQWWFGRRIIFEGQAIVRPNDQVLIASGKRIGSLPRHTRPENWTNLLTFEHDGRGKLMSNDELRQWWESDVLGFMSKIRPYAQLNETIDLPNSATPELKVAMLTAL